MPIYKDYLDDAFNLCGLEPNGVSLRSVMDIITGKEVYDGISCLQTLIDRGRFWRYRHGQRDGDNLFVTSSAISHNGDWNEAHCSLRLEQSYVVWSICLRLLWDMPLLSMPTCSTTTNRFIEFLWSWKSETVLSMLQRSIFFKSTLWSSYHSLFIIYRVGWS